MTDESDDHWPDDGPYPPALDESDIPEDFDTPYEPGLDEKTLLGVRAVFQDVAYSAGNLGQHLRGVDRLWTVCVAAASFSERQSARSRVVGGLESLSNDDSFEIDIQPMADAIFFGAVNVDTRRREGWEPLRLSAISRESPLWYDLTVHTEDVAPYAMAVGMFIRVMREPDRLGAWLPRLVLGWKRGWQEVDSVGKEEHDPFTLHKDPTELLVSTMRRHLPGIASELSILRPESVEILNGEELPEGSNEARAFS